MSVVVYMRSSQVSWLFWHHTNQEGGGGSELSSLTCDILLLPLVLSVLD
jgi:hypothetical protein